MLEIFIVVFLLIIITMLWKGFSRNLFLGGILLVDDSAFRQSCDNILSIIVDKVYAVNTDNTLTLDIFDKSVSGIPSPEYLYKKAIEDFPSLEGKITITINGKSAGADLRYFSTISCRQQIYTIGDNKIDVILTMIKG